MAITPQQVEYVAHLARLNITEEEKNRFAAQLGGILEYVDKLNELETGDVEPLVHLSDRENVFREDVNSPPLSRKDVLSNAPEQSEGCFKVPTIIE